jgi:hypothetical protein
MTHEVRRSSPNGIWLCEFCATLVDRDDSGYTVELLNDLKGQAVRDAANGCPGATAAGPEGIKTAAARAYIALLEEWSSRADLDNWQNWTFGLVSKDQPTISMERHDRLCDLLHWQAQRLWPPEYEEVRNALEGFASVLSDLLQVFAGHASLVGNVLQTDQDYRKSYSPALLSQYIDHVYLVQNLVLELTRAGNQVSGLARRDVDPGFRRNRNRLTVSIGPVETGDQLGTQIVCPEYEAGQAYPGLREFSRAAELRREWVPKLG